MKTKILVAIFLIAIITIIGLYISRLEIPEITKDIEEEIEKEIEGKVYIAKEWIKENVETYSQRGGHDLEYIRTVEVEENIYEITFEFNSLFAGYGPLEEAADAQVITSHIIVLVIENEEIVSAIINEEYDEIGNKKIKEIEDDEKIKNGEKEMDTVDIIVYFVTTEDGEEKYFSVDKKVSAENKEENALLKLLEGPEEQASYYSVISKEAELISFFIEDRTAYANFSKELDASGSAMVTMIRKQIEKTLLQFETIDDVVIMIDGESEDILQP